MKGDGAKRNGSRQPIGGRRGVPMRLGQVIARKYALTHLVLFVRDADGRSRIVTHGRGLLAGEMNSVQAAEWAGRLAQYLGWPEECCRIDTQFVKGLKKRIAELELELARIHEQEGDPIAIARRALKLPADV